MNVQRQFQRSLLIGCLLLSSPLLAEEAPITIQKSQSPDGRKDIILVPSEEDIGIASGTVKIRDVKTGRVFGSFDWGGFGTHASSTSFSVLWSPDNRCFAINWEQTRGFVGCAVYTQTRHGWHQVKLPDLGKLSLREAKAAGENEVYIDENWGGKGHETAMVWLPSHQLRIETGYRGIVAKKDAGDVQQRFQFTFHIRSSRAVLKSVELASDAADQNN